MKKLLVLILASATLITLSVWGGGERETASETEAVEEVQLNIAYAGGDPLYKQVISDIVENFAKENPYIIVKNEPSGTGSYPEFLKIKDAMGEFPDVVMIRNSTQYILANKLAVLPDELVNLLDEPVKFDGKVYFLPPGGVTIGIIYDKRFFRDNGLNDEPNNYDEFLSLCEKIKSLGVAPLVVGGKDIWHLGFFINKFLADELYSKNMNWNMDKNNSKVSWTDNEPKAALSKFIDLFKKGYVNKGFMSTPDNQTATILTSGDAAMLFSGPWMFGQIQQADPDFEIGFFPVPDDQGNVYLSVAEITNGWAISAEAAKDPGKFDAAGDFLKYFFRKDNYTKFVSTINFLPMTKEKITYDAIDAQQQVIKIFQDNPKIIFFDEMIGNQRIPMGFRDYMYKLTQEWILGTSNIEKGLALLDKEWDKLLKVQQSQQ